MLELRLVTVTDDGSALVLADPDGGSYRLPVDEALSAAVRGDRSRLGQLQIETSDLRPRDIQARVRAGVSPEALSTQTGIPLERVRRYAGPVLAEREHVVAMAHRATARVSSRAEGPAPQLYDAVEVRLHEAGMAAALVRWDAWRRDDGTWTIEVTHPVTHAAAKAAGAGPSSAVFGYDLTTRTAVAEDDHARWLLGEEPVVRAPFVPRLAAAPAAEEPLAEVLHEAEVVELDVATTHEEPALPGTGDDDDEPQEQVAEDSGPRRDRRAERRARRAAPRSEHLNAPTDRQAVADGVKPGRRAAVPSWDEILFGSARPPQ